MFEVGFEGKAQDVEHGKGTWAIGIVRRLQGVGMYWRRPLVLRSFISPIILSRSLLESDMSTGSGHR